MQCFQETMKGVIGWLRRVGTRRLWAHENFRAKRRPRSLQTRRSQSAISCCAFSRSKKLSFATWSNAKWRGSLRDLPPNRIENVSDLVVAPIAELTKWRIKIHD